MGGLIILAAILIPILLFGDLTNVYVWLMIISTVWLGLIGFLDDYIKVFRKKQGGTQRPLQSGRPDRSGNYRRACDVDESRYCHQGETGNPG